MSTVSVAEAVGRALVASGVDHVFGVVGSGNLVVTNAMCAAGARFVAARHESGATTMADGFARMSGRVAAVTVHQGCGLTNAMTGLTEAAKSRTPLVLVAAEATSPRSNFYVDQEALATSIGAVPMRITDSATAVQDAVAAVETAVCQRRTVLLNLPLDVQSQPCTDGTEARSPTPSERRVPAPGEVERLVGAIRDSRRPVFVAGRGGRPYAAELVSLARSVGALLAESAVAKGLFHDDEWSIGVSGGFASPGTADLVRGADLIVGWGCTLNMWTMRHGRLIAPDAVVVQVDDTADALGAYRELAFGVLGDVGRTAEAVESAWGSGDSVERYRTDETRQRLVSEIRWQDVPFDDTSREGLIDPRLLSLELDRILPADRVVAVDSGNFMGYPSMYLDVPDEVGFCFTQAFQSIGLGLATAIGAALARPDRLPVAALGDGGALMSAVELETVVRLGLPMLVVVYDDHAYGAEVHHFGPGGHDLDTVVFPDTDIAAIGRGFGFEAVTVRQASDLDAVRSWVDGPRDRPMLVDAKVVSDSGSWWLEEAFRGH